MRLSAPLAESSQATPGGKLVLFAKLYDVAPDGTRTLQNRLISPVRVGDVTRPVQVTLPAQVQRFAKGHRLQLVVAASDMAYAGNHVPQPVTIVTSRAEPRHAEAAAHGPAHVLRHLPGGRSATRRPASRTPTPSR